MLTTVPFAVAIVWGTHHLIAVITAFTGSGNPLALTWLVAFLLLWWVPVAWLERPHSVTADQAQVLSRKTVTVCVPAYNEPPHLLRQCLESLLAQSRLPTKIRVVDDGTTEYDYGTLESWFRAAAAQAGVLATWTRTPNRGKRHAQMEVLAHDDADIYLTLDSDTILEARAIEEGLKPFARSDVFSVAGMVAVWNSHGNWLARLTCMLYTPFTRGFRSAQSVLGQVMVNSGTLAWYRGELIRRYAGVYENEQFMGRPMQMNDDSMMTFYGLLAGRTVHQPTAVGYTIVPERFGQYRRQQMRWMRGTFVRTWWWIRYMPITRAAFWMPLCELAQLALSLVIWPLVLLNAGVIGGRIEFLLAAAVVALLLNYIISLRYFIIRRSDESLAFEISVYLLAPLAGVWRLVVLRPMMIYCYLTFWRVSAWGTRQQNVDASQPAISRAGWSARWAVLRSGEWEAALPPSPNGHDRAPALPQHPFEDAWRMLVNTER